MKFGLAFANAFYGGGEAALLLAGEAEAAGVESLWTVEHVVVPVGYESPYPYDPSGKMPGGREDFDIPDPMMWLAYIASQTSRIKLATGIVILPQRNPLIMAKEVATLDAMSSGRVIFGIGVGWLAEEFAALGVPFDERGKRTDEYMAIMRAVWSGEATEFHGEFFDFPKLFVKPKPPSGSVPIVIGGHTEVAARRAGRIGDGFFPGGGSIEELTHIFKIVRDTAIDNGRDPDVIELTAAADARGEKREQRLEQLAALGVTRVIISPPMPGQFEATSELIKSYADL